MMRVSAAVRVLSLLFAGVAAHAEDPARCLTDHLYSSLAPAVTDARALLQKRWNSLASEQKIKRISAARDQIREKLSVLHGRPYPTTVLGGDAETPLNAYDYAKSAFGELTDEQAQLIKPAEVQETLSGLLDQVENYGDRVKAYEDETATWVAQEKWLSEQLKQENLKPFGIAENLPVVKHDAASERGWSFDTKADYAGYVGALEVQRNELKKQLRKRLRPRLLGGLNTVPADDPMLRQAYDLKTLEIYFHELKRQKIGHPGVEFPPEVQKTFDRIQKLYTPDLQGFRADVKPPDWAWEKMHWAWLWGETRAVFLKDLPALQHKINNSNVIKFSKTLSGDDLRATVGDNLADGASTLSRLKPVALVLGLGGAGSGAEVSHLIFQYFTSDATNRDEIAREPDDATAASKLNDYLNSKFIGKQVWDSDNKLVYPPAIAEVGRIVELRKKALGKDARIEELKKRLHRPDESEKPDQN